VRAGSREEGVSVGRDEFAERVCEEQIRARSIGSSVDDFESMAGANDGHGVQVPLTAGALQHYAKLIP